MLEQERQNVTASVAALDRQVPALDHCTCERNYKNIKVKSNETAT
jgi:hypothetical protein